MKNAVKTFNRNRASLCFPNLSAKKKNFKNETGIVQKEGDSRRNQKE